MREFSGQWKEEGWEKWTKFPKLNKLVGNEIIYQEYAGFETVGPGERVKVWNITMENGQVTGKLLQVKFYKIL